MAWQSFFFNDIEYVIHIYNLRNGKFIITFTTFEALKYLLEAVYNCRVWSDISLTFFSYTYVLISLIILKIGYLFITVYYQNLEFSDTDSDTVVKFALLNLNVSTYNIMYLSFRKTTLRYVSPSRDLQISLVINVST